MAAHDETYHALNFEGCVEESDIKLFEESPYSRSRRGLYLLPLDPAMPGTVLAVNGFVGSVAVGIGGEVMVLAW